MSVFSSFMAPIFYSSSTKMFFGAEQTIFLRLYFEIERGIRFSLLFSEYWRRQLNFSTKFIGTGSFYGSFWGLRELFCREIKFFWLFLAVEEP